MKENLYRNFEFKAEIKELGENGTFSGIASVMGVEDLGGDIIDKGAFNKTLEENPNPLILWQHDPSEPIGQGEIKQWQGKILISGKLDIENDPTAQKAYQKLKSKLVKGLSIGFTTVKASWEEVKENGATRFIRHIQELKLWEVSIVTFPMQMQAQVTRVKAMSDSTRSMMSSVMSDHEDLMQSHMRLMEEHQKVMGRMRDAMDEDSSNKSQPALSATQLATPQGAGAGEGAANPTQEPAHDHSRLSYLIEKIRSQI